MTEQKFPAVPDEKRMEELLKKIQPVPSEDFQQKMKQAVWRIENRISEVKSQSNHRMRLAVAMTVLFLLAGLLISPQGRAWAQEIFQFFKRINSTTIPLSEEELKRIEIFDEPYDLPLVPVSVPAVPPELAALPGCGTPHESQSYRCQVTLAESKLGFDLKEWPELPEGWKFESIYFDTASKNATIRYTFDHHYRNSGMLYLTQGVGEVPSLYNMIPWTVVPADKVETVKVGNYDGEYVKGSFVVDGDHLKWEDTHLEQQLAWSDGTRWYLIERFPNMNLPNTVDRDQLIELAESLVNTPSDQSETLNPEFLYSVSDAERVSGFDLKAPTLLPMEMDFAYARYFPDHQGVRLFYGMNNELEIYQWKGKSLYFDALSTSSPGYEIVDVSGEKAFFGTATGADTYQFLWWQKDGIYYQMYYYEYFSAKLGKEKMIAIAESMQDFDDFRTKGHKPYEYVSIYAQALGFDAKEFPKPLTRWSFANVWGDPFARCITLIYNSTTEQGVLFITQCRTNKRFNVSEFPANAVERVQIGGNQGQYILGNFVAGNTTERVWGPAAPLKQLYWQEDGLWIQLGISGNSSMIHDKEDLIAIAESLR